MFAFINHSAQCIVVSVRSHVMSGAVQRTEKESRMNIAQASISLEWHAPVTRTGAAVNGKSACGLRWVQNADKKESLNSPNYRAYAEALLSHAHQPETRPVPF